MTVIFHIIRVMVVPMVCFTVVECGGKTISCCKYTLDTIVRVVVVAMVVAMVCFTMVECGGKTISCSHCDWELKVQTHSEFWSGSDCDIRLRVFFENSTKSDWMELNTGKDNFVVGYKDEFVLDISDSTNKVLYYKMGVWNRGCKYDKWQPRWTELRNKKRPKQVKRGRCNFGGIWVGQGVSICCQGSNGRVCELVGYIVD